MVFCWSWIWALSCTCLRNFHLRFNFRVCTLKRNAWYLFQHRVHSLSERWLQRPSQYWARGWTESWRRLACHWPWSQRLHVSEKPRPNSSSHHGSDVAQVIGSRDCSSEHNAQVADCVRYERSWSKISPWLLTYRRTLGTWPHCAVSTSYGDGSLCSIQLRYASKMIILLM